MANRILDDKDCATCDKVLRKMAELREDIEKCRACGLDMDEAETRRAFLEHRATQIKRQFFHDRP